MVQRNEEKLAERVEQLESHIFVKPKLDNLNLEDRLTRMEKAINLLLEEKDWPRFISQFLPHFYWAKCNRNNQIAML